MGSTISLNKMGQVNRSWIPAFIFICFLTADTQRSTVYCRAAMTPQHDGLHPGTVSPNKPLIPCVLDWGEFCWLLWPSFSIKWANDSVDKCICRQTQWLQFDSQNHTVEGESQLLQIFLASTCLPCLTHKEKKIWLGLARPGFGCSASIQVELFAFCYLRITARQEA